MVKDKLLYHAIKQAYEGILDPGRFPACLLYFTIDTREVDVNVHPTKHEVRFQQPRLVHDFFISQLSQALKPDSASLISVNALPSLPDKQLNYTLKESTPVFYNQISWVVLNSDYGILFKFGNPHLVNMKALYHTGLAQDLHKQELPFAHRALLVPLRYALPEADSNKVQLIQKELAAFGVMLDRDGDFFKVNSIPVAVPQLDVRGVLDALFREGIFEKTAIIESLCRHQFFDAAQLSTEEKNALYKVMEEVCTENFCKELTLDDCRKCLKSFV